MNPWDPPTLEDVLNLLADLGYALQCVTFEDEAYWSYVKYEEDGTEIVISNGEGALPDPDDTHYMLYHGKRYFEYEYPSLATLVLCEEAEEREWGERRDVYVNIAAA